MTVYLLLISIYIKANPHSLTDRLPDHKISGTTGGIAMNLGTQIPLRS